MRSVSWSLLSPPAPASPLWAHDRRQRPPAAPILGSLQPCHRDHRFREDGLPGSRQWLALRHPQAKFTASANLREPSASPKGTCPAHRSASPPTRPPPLDLALPKLCAPPPLQLAQWHFCFTMSNSSRKWRAGGAGPRDEK